jgi:hypothetical protein
MFPDNPGSLAFLFGTAGTGSQQKSAGASGDWRITFGWDSEDIIDGFSAIAS